MKIHLSLGSSFPLRSPVEVLSEGLPCLEDPFLGPLSLEKIQIGPQNCSLGYHVGPENLSLLGEMFPGISFRLHANVHFGKPVLFNSGNMSRFPEHRRQLVSALRQLGQPYILHPGARVTLEKQFDNCRRLEQEAGVPVGVEGMYGDGGMGTWEEYETLLEANVHFAVDLSHLNIVRTQRGEGRPGLVRELLEHPRCLEVHVSGNDGSRDNHQQLTEEPFWWSDFLGADIKGDVFYEGRLS